MFQDKVTSLQYMFLFYRLCTTKILNYCASFRCFLHVNLIHYSNFAVNTD